MNEKKQTKVINLQEIMNYENEDVIFRFRKLFNIKEEEAISIFNETKKWIYASYVNSLLFNDNIHSFRLGINSDILIIDEMWHNFILFTKDYHAFCHRYFNEFIHHQPTPKKESVLVEKKEQLDFNLVQEERKIFFKKQYSFIYDLLGAETVIKWHKEYPIKYSSDEIRKLRK